jgi:hypothetical protein
MEQHSEARRRAIAARDCGDSAFNWLLDDGDSSTLVRLRAIECTVTVISLKGLGHQKDLAQNARGRGFWRSRMEHDIHTLKVLRRDKLRDIKRKPPVARTRYLFARIG